MADDFTPSSLEDNNQKEKSTIAIAGLDLSEEMEKPEVYHVAFENPIKVDKSGKVLFYETTDQAFIINLSDISFMERCKKYEAGSELNNLDYLNSYFNIHMKANGETLKVGYRDGLQIMNILRSDYYGLFINNPERIKTDFGDFSCPDELDKEYSDLSYLVYSDKKNLYDTGIETWKNVL